VLLVEKRQLVVAAKLLAFLGVLQARLLLWTSNWTEECGLASAAPIDE
jgi:hypothetical protein